MTAQEIITFGIVFLASIYLFAQGLNKFLESYFAEFISQWLLNRGQVKFAMWFRKRLAQSRGCSNCSCH